MYVFDRESECFWYEPLPFHGLQTRPGLFTDPSSPTPTDTVVRYSCDYVGQITRRGGHFSTEDEFRAYMDKPTKEVWEEPELAFRFPLSSSQSPEFSSVTGNSTIGVPMAVTQESKRRTYTRDERKGISNDNFKSKPNRPDAPGKYSVNPHPYFELSAEAFPEGTPDSIIAEGKQSFSSSITRKSQSNYATAINHLRRAEDVLGRLTIVSELGHICFNGFSIVSVHNWNNVSAHLNIRFERDDSFAT